MDGLLGRILALWVRATLRPEDAAARLPDRQMPVCYVLERRSGVDLAVLQSVCVRERLPRPGRRLLARHLGRRRSYFALARTVGLWRVRLDRRPSETLLLLIDALRTDPTLDVNLVPAAVYWGRAPQKEGSLIRLLLSENWVIGSRLRGAFTVLLNGRNTTVQLGDGLSLRGFIESDDNALTARRVARAVSVQFARLRTARIGPDLSHRRTIVAQVLRTRAVRAVVAQELREHRRITRRQALLQARRYANEIAANYSPAFVTLMSYVLRRVWDRLYDGVEFHHTDTLQQVAEGNEIIYVPCHRSHMDYLLLSYAIYQRGFAIPHIAAGLNLNLPVIGRLLRLGGAFFIRRSFRGSAVYAVVFSKYLAAIMARGHSIEYFIEGGRSRTGRLLAPMTGMLSMTVRSYVREPRRPVVFVPVYFGYERVVEGAAYVNELAGKPKERESILKLVRSVLRLLTRERLGRVHVSLGEPIRLDCLLERYAPDWRDRSVEEHNRPAWLGALTDELAATIMRRINAAATVTPINLLAVILLATPRQSMLESDLLKQIETMVAVLEALPYSDRVSVTQASPARAIEEAISLGMISREQHGSGPVVRMSVEHAVLATYYRNNVLHLFAMPSLIACCFLANAAMSSEDIQRLAGRIYPYVAAELFLPWSEAQVPQIVERMLAAFARLGLLQAGAGACPRWQRPQPDSGGAMQLSVLAQSTVQTIERYYLAIALLIHAGSGQITQKALEQRCRLMAQRMTLLYDLNSPEFFDRSLFENFIDLLRARSVVRVDEAGRLLFDEVLMQVAADAQLVLSEQIRHSILQVTHS